MELKRKMKTINGDLIRMAFAGEFDVIIHGCNCFNTMSAGIAAQIKRYFYMNVHLDLLTKRGDMDKLGTVDSALYYFNNQTLVVVNAYTQYHTASFNGECVVDYDAIRQSFRGIKKQFSGSRIGYPAIGAGLAGGDWNIISEIIDEELDGEDHTFVEYDG